MRQKKYPALVCAAGLSVMLFSACSTAEAPLVSAAPSAEAVSAQPGSSAAVDAESAVSANFASLSAKVQDLVSRMDKAAAPDYKGLKKEAKLLENDIGRAEDQAKLDYYGGLIQREDYDKAEYRLDIMEDLLSDAEDAMEARLGIID